MDGRKEAYMSDVAARHEIDSLPREARDSASEDVFSAVMDRK